MANLSWAYSIPGQNGMVKSSVISRGFQLFNDLVNHVPRHYYISRRQTVYYPRVNLISCKQRLLGICYKWPDLFHDLVTVPDEDTMGRFNCQ